MRRSAAFGLVITGLVAAFVVIVVGVFDPAAEAPCESVAVATTTEVPTTATVPNRTTRSTTERGGNRRFPVTTDTPSTAVPTSESTLAPEQECATSGPAAEVGVQ